MHTPHYLKHKAAIQRRNRIREKADARIRMLKGARHRAKKSGHPCTIALTDIVIPKRCPVLGTMMRRNAGKPGPMSPTLDRIHPPLGYVPGNVWVISHRANMLKNDATLAELKALVRAMEQHQ